MYGYTENQRYKKTYYCCECNAQVSKNCGHWYFGNRRYLRDLTPGKTYWCRKCNAQVSKNCGHFCFGNIDWFRDLTPGKYYWYSDWCGALVSENCSH